MWNWSLISFDLPQPIRDKIKAVPVQIYGIREDTITWKAAKDGDFSTSSAYQLALPNYTPGTPFMGSWIWKMDMLPRIINFLWLCYHNSVPVRDILATRGICYNYICPICGRQRETIVHVLRDCEFASFCWSKIQLPQAAKSSFSEDLFEWLRINCQSKVIHHSSIPWSILFPFAIWAIWKHRNRVCFDNCPPNLNLYKSCINQAFEFFFCVSKTRSQRHNIVIPVKWLKPPTGWMKLNTDGASLGNPGTAGAGGVIRNCLGSWVKGFSRAVGFATSITAEFWGLRDGLMLASQLGIQDIVVELDAKIVVELLQSKHVANNSFLPLLNDCRSLLSNFQQVRVKHTFREANRCADALARKGCYLQEDFVIFDFPPSVDIESYVTTDANGMYYGRLATASLAILAS